MNSYKKVFIHHVVNNTILIIKDIVQIIYDYCGDTIKYKIIDDAYKMPTCIRCANHSVDFYYNSIKNKYTHKIKTYIEYIYITSLRYYNQSKNIIIIFKGYNHIVFTVNNSEVSLKIVLRLETDTFPFIKFKITGIRKFNSDFNKLEFDDTDTNKAKRIYMKVKYNETCLLSTGDNNPNITYVDPRSYILFNINTSEIIDCVVHEQLSKDEIMFFYNQFIPELNQFIFLCKYVNINLIQM